MYLSFKLLLICVLASLAACRGVPDEDRFLAAAAAGETQVVRDLLREQKVNVNLQKHGETAIGLASHYGRTDVLKVLVENRANLNTRNSNGFTPLMSAVIGGHLESVRVLLENGSDTTLVIDDLDSGGRPVSVLDLAKAKGNPEIVELISRVSAVER